MQPAFVKIRKLLLLLGDLGILYASLYFTLLIRYGGSITVQTWQDHLVPFTIIYVIWLLVFYINDLYDLSLAKSAMNFSRKFLQCLVLNILIAVVFFYTIPYLGIAPKTNLLINILVFVILAYAWRMFFNAIISRSVFANRILFLGPEPKFISLMNDLKNNRYHGWKIVAVWDPAQEKEYKRDQIKYFKNTTPLEQAIKQEKINTVILAVETRQNPDLAKNLYNCVLRQISIINLAKFYEIVTGHLPAEHLSESWFLENLKEADKKVYDSMKQLYDFFLSLVFGAFFIATLPVFGLLILLDDGWPVFYSQKRVGKGGKHFKIFKYRTMRRDAECQGMLFAAKDDDRVTRVGRVYRKARIDELPQVINVFKGDMSFIGPRPERPEFVQELEQMMPFYATRHLTRPGLTGWAQINYEYAASLEENLKKLQYDLYYIKNRSLLLDIKILLKTLGIILSRKGQ